MSTNGRCGRRRMWQQPQHRDASALQPGSSPHIWTGPVADAFQVSTGDWYHLCGLGRVGFPINGRTVQMWTGTQLFSHNEDSPSYMDWVPFIFSQLDLTLTTSVCPLHNAQVFVHKVK